MGRFDIFPIFIATFASRRVTLIATHSKSQKQTRLPIRYLYFILPFKPLINKEVIKVFQNYQNIFVAVTCFCQCRKSGNVLIIAKGYRPGNAEMGLSRIPHSILWA